MPSMRLFLLFLVILFSNTQLQVLRLSPGIKDFRDSYIANFSTGHSDIDSAWGHTTGFHRQVFNNVILSRGS